MTQKVQPVWESGDGRNPAVGLSQITAVEGSLGSRPTTVIASLNFCDLACHRPRPAEAGASAQPEPPLKPR